MTCAKCGTVNAAGAGFCSNCGTALTPTVYQSVARGAVVAQNVALIQLVGMVLGFVGGVILGAYVFLPMGGVGAILAIAAPIIGLVVGQRVLIGLMAR